MRPYYDNDDELQYVLKTFKFNNNCSIAHMYAPKLNGQKLIMTTKTILINRG
ncbi:hypothetical protein YTPLAS21_05880 [Candidatus Nitrosocosmicus sp.]|nr:hypothetical protein YTPLAS21_05880 [Candidatus Nitrosocosmicus sp.]